MGGCVWMVFTQTSKVGLPAPEKQGSAVPSGIKDGAHIFLGRALKYIDTRCLSMVYAHCLLSPASYLLCSYM